MAATRLVAGTWREVWHELVPLDGGNSDAITTGISVANLARVDAVCYIDAVGGTPNISGSLSVNAAGKLVVTITNSAAPGNTAIFTLDVIYIESTQQSNGSSAASPVFIVGGVNLAPAFGPQGYQGMQGRQGRQGWQGPGNVPGAQGNQGWQGNAGMQGYQGRQGNQGSQGEQGLQGWQGNQGEQGWQGWQGPGNELGPQGTQGNQGWQGWQGEQGWQGWQGPGNELGPQGNQGWQGWQGWQGSQGNQGWQGPGNELGPQGNQGNQGWQGPGQQGNQGSQGFQGWQGPGQQGWQGPGQQGNQGWQGPASGGGSGGFFTLLGIPRQISGGDPVGFAVSGDTNSTQLTTYATNGLQNAKNVFPIIAPGNGTIDSMVFTIEGSAISQGGPVSDPYMRIDFYRMNWNSTTSLGSFDVSLNAAKVGINNSPTTTDYKQTVKLSSIAIAVSQGDAIGVVWVPQGGDNSKINAIINMFGVLKIALS